MIDCRCKAKLAWIVAVVGEVLKAVLEGLDIHVQIRMSAQGLLEHVMRMIVLEEKIVI